MSASKPAAGHPEPEPSNSSRRFLTLRYWRRGPSSARLAALVTQLPKRLLAALQMTIPDAPEWGRRVLLMERDIMLPIKFVGLSLLGLFVYRRNWLADIATALDIQFEVGYFLWAYAAFFWCYILANLCAGTWLLITRKPSISLLQWVPFALCLLDGILLSLLVLFTGGYNSVLFWLYLGLIVRTAVSVPRNSQVVVNLALTACFMFTGYIDVKLAAVLDPQSKASLILPEDYLTEPVFMRLLVLVMMTICCYALSVLLQRHLRMEEIAREVAARDGALRSAGRLAAEFAHQFKNPLAIINTAVFSMKRDIRNNRADATPQIEMIQEEVERVDRIITEVMGYAQLSEGHVEELNTAEQLDMAIAEVFPPAARYPVRVHRSYDRLLPPLLMQRRHVSEVFVNMLQNAREALGDKGGNVFITARCLSDGSLEVSIRDDGPGIPPEKHEQVFEAYFTTKVKGTGLGLATVKHNVGLYGGRVRVESALGKGARFILVFPAKTLTSTFKSA